MSRKYLTTEQIQFLSDNVTLYSGKALTAAFNARFGTDKKYHQIKNALYRNKLRSGRIGGQFHVGMTPWNEGTRGVMKRNSGTFEPGHVSANTKPVGYERLNKDGFVEIKINQPNPYTKATTRFRHKHVYLWEQANGPVPTNHVIMFKDGNKRNFDMENLICVNRAVSLWLNRNNYYQLPVEVRDSAIALAKLRTTTFKLMKGKRV